MRSILVTWQESFLSSSGTGKHDSDYLRGKNTSETIYSNAEGLHMMKHMMKLSQVNIVAFVAFLLNSFPHQAS